MPIVRRVFRISPPSQRLIRADKNPDTTHPIPPKKSGRIARFARSVSDSIGYRSLRNVGSHVM